MDSGIAHCYLIIGPLASEKERESDFSAFWWMNTLPVRQSYLRKTHMRERERDLNLLKPVGPVSNLQEQGQKNMLKDTKRTQSVKARQ